MKEEMEILLELYKEQRDLGMHHENQRSTVTNLILTLCTIILGVIFYDKAVTTVDGVPAIVVMGLGIYGRMFTKKHYERFQFHRFRSRMYLAAIDELLLDFDKLFPAGSHLGKKVRKRLDNGRDELAINKRLFGGDRNAVYPENVVERLKLAADSHYLVRKSEYIKLKGGESELFNGLPLYFVKTLNGFWSSLYNIITSLGFLLAVWAFFLTSN